MESPAKRRKKNDSKHSAVTHRNLDFFFRKQSNKEQDVTNGPADNGREETHKPSPSEQHLTDEELARKLQEEWANEDKRDSPRYDSAGDMSSGKQEDTEHKVEKDRNKFVAAAPKDNPPFEPQQTANATVKRVLGLQSTASEEDTITLTVPFDQSPLTFDPSQ